MFNNINRLALGGIPIQRDDVKNAELLIHEMIEDGFCMIDSAKAYSVSEKWIGAGIKDNRDKFFLATKSMAKDQETMSKDIDDSLEKFQTTYIDLYQFHNIASTEDYRRVMAEDGAYQALLQAQQQGKIKHIGLTSHSADFVKTIIDDFPFASLQMPYNLVEQENAEIFAKAKAQGVLTIAMKPLCGGAIDDTDLALRFFNSEELIDIVLVGMADVKEYQNNKAALKQGFSAEDKVKADKIQKEIGSNFCRRCGYCMPCPQDINISLMWLVELYYNRYGLKDWAKSRYDSQTANATDCIECGICEAQCPYNLEIIKKMKEVSELVTNE